jgi:hypothetical protein
MQVLLLKNMKIIYKFGVAKKWYHLIPAWLITNVGYFMPDNYVLLSIKLKREKQYETQNQ